MKNYKKYRKLGIGEKLIKDFEEKGFAEASNYHLLNKLRERYDFKLFDSGHRISAGRYKETGTYNIFGEKLNYFYDRMRKEEFIDFLVEKFYSKNPDADSETRSGFTRILHVNGLCWYGCVLHKSRWKEEMERRREEKH